MKRNKIILEPQIYNDQLYGGISRYYTEIFEHLNRNENLSIVIPFIKTKNFYFINSSLFTKSHKIYIFGLKVLRILNFLSKKKIDKILYNNLMKTLSSNCDLIIPTYYNPYFLNCSKKKPFVLTVYDMIYELFPNLFLDDPHNIVKNKLLLMERATKIIAVSNNTKKDILTLYPHIEHSKIEVIHHGTSIRINEKSKVDLPPNFILYVGSRWHYKNFIFFIESLSNLLHEDNTLKIVCAGGSEFNTEELGLIQRLNINDRVIHLKFKDEDLGYIYSKAKCFVFPSIYEGFGIPILEAMACGCPIVLSNNSSFPEVAGDAGLFFELDQPKDLYDKVKEVIINEVLRDELVNKGLNRVRDFNWEKAAQECLNVYLEAIKQAN